jgi:hypothetical protein
MFKYRGHMADEQACEVIRVSFTVRVHGPGGAQRRQFLITPKAQKTYTAEELRALDEALKNAVRDCLR